MDLLTISNSLMIYASYCLFASELIQPLGYESLINCDDVTTKL